MALKLQKLKATEVVGLDPRISNVHQKRQKEARSSCVGVSLGS